MTNLKKEKKILIKIFPYIAGILLGYAAHYYLFSELLVTFLYGYHFYFFANICTLIGSMVGFFILTNLILTRKINRKLFYLIMAMYFSLLLLALFGRTSFESFFILNPIQGIKDLVDPEMRLETLLNIIMFIPMGYVLKNIKYKRVVMVVIAVAVELVQYITLRGYCDTLDMIVYCIGMELGIFIFTKINLNIE